MMSNKIVYNQVKNGISVAEERDVDLNFKKKPIANHEDYETILSDTLQKQQQNNNHSATDSNPVLSEVELIKNLLNPTQHFVDHQLDNDETMTLINNEKQTNRQLQHSYSTDYHHLYPNAASIDGQATIELDRLRKINAFLMGKIQFLTNENKTLVDKSKEHLSIIRTEKAHEEQLNSMRSQLSIQDNTISDLREESKLWQNKYLELNAKHQQLIRQSEEEKIELKESNKLLRRKNDEFEVDLEKCLAKRSELESENKYLNKRLFHATTELEQIKKSSDSCETLRNNGLRSQQKCHVISEKLEACKIKLEQSTNLLKEKSCLVDQQKKEIKDLNANINDLKKVNSFNQIEIEKNKNRIEHLEIKLKEKDDLVNEYKSLYHEIKNTRENEIKHEQHTIKALIMINSKYETELAQIKCDLELIRYDQIVNEKKVPDLLEHNREVDRMIRLKKKYAHNDLYDEVYESVDATLLNESSHKVVNGEPQSNGYVVAKKIPNPMSNGNVHTNNNAKATLNIGLNGSNDCATAIISETALPS